MKTPEGFSSSRRRLLIAAGAGVLACGALGTWSWNLYANGRARWIEQAVRNNLPGITLDEPSLALFVRDTLASESMQSQRRRLGIVAETILPWMTKHMSVIHQAVAITERQVLSDFLLGSNFFRVSDPRRETITYYGRTLACANPFVRRS